MLSVLFAIALLVGSAVASPTPIQLPGAPAGANFSLYSGYAKVDAASNRNLFWMFAEAKNVDPATAPVVLWLTGGPGCSSLIAFLSENGPYRPDANNPSALISDDYAWNDNANVLWLESPAGVGFSFSDNPADYNTNDTRTTEDTYAALQMFFTDLFPQYQKNRFYVSGESYGGHYVPLISLYVVQSNKNPQNTFINIQGYLAGNAWTWMPLDNLGALETYQDRAIVAKVDTDNVIKHCNLSYVGPLHKRDELCNQMINKAMESFEYVDIYDIYVDVCPTGSGLKMKMLNQMAKVSWFHAKLLDAVTKRRDFKKRNWPLPPFDKCADDHLTKYLNNIDVQKAINAIPQDARTGIKWTECSDVVNYDFNSVATSMLPTLKELFANPNFHALVYSGDVDAIVPFAGTRNWIDYLNPTVIEPWKVWLDQNKQAGGFRTVYDGFTFTTVRGAGHMAPQYKPARSYQMFNAWLHNHTIF